VSGKLSESQTGGEFSDSKSLREVVNPRFLIVFGGSARAYASVLLGILWNLLPGIFSSRRESLPARRNLLPGDYQRSLNNRRSRTGSLPTKTRPDGFPMNAATLTVVCLYHQVPVSASEKRPL